MNPIINPWLFYFADTSDSVKLVFTAIATTIFLMAICTLLKKMPIQDYEDLEFLKKYAKIAIPSLVASVILCIAIPSKSTIYKMAAASVATEDNIIAAGESAEKVVNYIVESVEKIMGDESK